VQAEQARALELDRAGVERKIREAQTLLHAHDQKSP